jgi:uncharacterized protein YbaR (Trm112 family)
VFIELAEYLRCPTDHKEQSYCVVVPDTMDGRDVQTGSIGCPICKREYPIVEGEARFGAETPPAAPDRASPALPDADTVRALLGLAGPGGYVVLVGSAGGLAPALAERLNGVHLISVNPPLGVRSATGMSVLRDDARIPLRDSMARGIVIGADHTSPAWVTEAVRVLLRGLRLVILREDVTIAGVEMLVREQGMGVGTKS